MSSWEEEKDKYLKLLPEAKQKNFIRLEKIPTWKHLCESEILPDPVFMKDNCALDISKNEILAEKVSIFDGDITLLAIDAIVNAANSSLSAIDGLSETIHNIAGPSLELECSTLAPCKTGEAKITGGYKLPARYVIHTVGPQGEYPEKLKRCYRESLELLISKNLRTIAFPCISTGSNNGYPNLPAAHAAAYQVRKFLEDNGDKIDRVIFCLMSEKNRKTYRGILQTYFPLSH
ncbi:ADP-ribose glycohydrolase MACROD1-like [Coccinella septempunctata]|uniref:ADP-ribose glycohydrolase MACROD1-like n=1 Tax=Coccinella septempunctata TaxID=41139 RepID=UPI001D065BCF|nr:ADP-ribose glycohydrolase MACROD1-like [Coccinella septempunctata]